MYLEYHQWLERWALNLTLSQHKNFHAIRAMLDGCAESRPTSNIFIFYPGCSEEFILAKSIEVAFAFDAKLEII